MGLQVTDWSAQAMQIRCLVTCRNSSESFDFGCDIREHMATYIQEHYPLAFPNTRYIQREWELKGDRTGLSDQTHNGAKAA
jgi:hypothetical protein